MFSPLRIILLFGLLGYMEVITMLLEWKYNNIFFFLNIVVNTLFYKKCWLLPFPTSNSSSPAISIKFLLLDTAQNNFGLTQHPVKQTSFTTTCLAAPSVVTLTNYPARLRKRKKRFRPFPMLFSRTTPDGAANSRDYENLAGGPSSRHRADTQIICLTDKVAK